ncbi:MAG: DUF6531 domain-containing protein [Bdellovibrionota bacterium]
MGATAKKMFGIAFGLALISAVVQSGPAMANVSLKNGNFFMGYTDINYPGGFEPRIERVYNSKTPFKGIFGWGWGNEYEAYLEVSADGSVVVHEYGGGAENRFTPVAFKASELDAAVASLVDAKRKMGGIGSTAQADAEKKKLKTDAYYRNEEWKKLVAMGKLSARKLPNGTQLHSNRFSYQYITKVDAGYVRAFDNGRVEKFDEMGRLTRINDRNSNFVELAYGKDGKIEKIVDNFNRKIFFSFNKKGLVEKIEGEGGKVAVYKYNDQDELSWSKDVDANVYEYKYSPNKNHNMVQIAYSDKTTMEMAYFGRDLFENIKSVKDRSGNTTSYAYEYGKGGNKFQKIAVSVVGPDKKPISKSAYEYFLALKATGEEWTRKMVSVVDGDRTETVYNECCGLPLSIKRNGLETAFEYDTKGHVTKKTTPFEVTELKYDPKAGKVARVARYSKKNKKASSWSEFNYDEKGNLIFAKNSEGKGVKLLYDTNGRIKSLVDQERKQLHFKYDPQTSKPIEISDPALGTITVSYNAAGEIKKVESSAGRKIAMQVTSAFQNLLDIIRPAGVSLSF